MQLKEYFSQKKQEIDFYLNQYLPKEKSSRLVEAMRYSLFAGGKRFRPILALATAELFGLPQKIIMPAACAIEMIHTFTLVHDDLPAMDNDDFRRGKLTNHKVFGEDIAILAGDALHILAFEILVRFTPIKKTSNLNQVMLILCEALGKEGVVNGQVLDMQAQEQSLSFKELQNIHQKKTGIFICACCKIPAVLAGASTKQLGALEKYSSHLGLAFQIADDILDVEGSFKEMGKSPGSDQQNNKSTFVTLLGLEKAKSFAQTEIDKAKKSLLVFPKAKRKTLEEIADFTINRNF